MRIRVSRHCMSSYVHVCMRESERERQRAREREREREREMDSSLTAMCQCSLADVCVCVRACMPVSVCVCACVPVSIRVYACVYALLSSGNCFDCTNCSNCPNCCNGQRSHHRGYYRHKCGRTSLPHQVNPNCTCFTSKKVQILTLLRLAGLSAMS